MELRTRRDELAHFLQTRRARLTPAIAAEPGRRRRTAGLTREEVAAASHISTAWYTWLEQGRDIRVSGAALSRIADALRLDAGERVHLFHLAELALPLQSRTEEVSVELRNMLDGMGANVVYLTNHCWDVLAWSEAARYGFVDYATLAPSARNVVLDFFTTSERRTQFVDWEQHAHRVVAEFRASYGRHKNDARFAPLIERCRTSPEFAHWWDEHDVGERRPGTVEFQHALLGRLTFTSTTFAPNAGGSLRMTIYAPADDRTRAALATALRR